MRKIKPVRIKKLRILMFQEEFDQLVAEQKKVARGVPLSRYAREKLLNLRK